MGKKILKFETFKDAAKTSQKGKFKPKGTSKIAKHLKGGREGAKGYKTMSEGALNEDLQWYIDKGYVKNDSIKSFEDLEKNIMSRINPALKKFCDEKKISPVMVASDMQPDRKESAYLKIQSENIPADKLGIFAACLQSAKFYLFSGREVAFHKDEESGDFYFRPYIWGTVHISYESIGGGSNGLSYPVAQFDGRGRDDIWYDIVEGVWFDVNKMSEIERKNRKNG